MAGSEHRRKGFTQGTVKLQDPLLQDRVAEIFRELRKAQVDKTHQRLLNTKMSIKAYKIHYLQISRGWESTPRKSRKQGIEQGTPLVWVGIFVLMFLSMHVQNSGP